MVTKGDEMVMKWFIAKTSVCPARGRVTTLLQDQKHSNLIFDHPGEHHISMATLLIRRQSMITKGDEMVHSKDITTSGEKLCKAFVTRPETF